MYPWEDDLDLEEYEYDFTCDFPVPPNPRRELCDEIRTYIQAKADEQFLLYDKVYDLLESDDEVDLMRLLFYDEQLEQLEKSIAYWKAFLIDIETKWRLK